MPRDDGDLTGHVIIGGYGRVGQAVGRMLAAEHIPFVALDSNGELVSEFSEPPGVVLFRRCRAR